MPVMGVVKFERFFRRAAGIDVDRNDLKRYDEFLNEKINDLFVIATAKANANGRDIVEWADVPITAGLQRSIHEFRKLDEEIELRPLLEALAALSPDITLSEDTGARLPLIAGGLSLALGRTIRVIRPETHSVHTEQWDRAFQIFHLLL
jgi:hypothetical protein